MTSRDILPDAFTQNATLSTGGPTDERTPLLHASRHKAKSPDADVTEEVIVAEPADEEDIEALRRSPDGAHTLHAVSGRALWKASLILPFLGIFMLLVFMFDKGLRERHRKGSPDVFDPKQPDTPPLGLSNKITKHWGQYAPYLRAGKYKQPPDGCVIDQVNILHRHGARYPNEDDAPSYVEAIAGFASATEFRDSKLKFLGEYEYELPAEALVPYGAEQSWRSGVEAYGRYEKLLGTDRNELGGQVYVRTTTKGRVKDSAGNWTEGMPRTERLNGTVLIDTSSQKRLTTH
ncbi:hypothetical protein NM688_g7444 [Phlebia brevispora]|uniref:Uncharacterized protein n=1 Tax=Phlebia brevispora TaxID=194682 RepID=A0ACC1S521_9APHY|nr:hypothetical protein NM688_g7444 [Phlebia brevispora]